MGAIVAASLPLSGAPESHDLEMAVHRAFVLGALVSVLALGAGLLVPRGRPPQPTV